jgi:hypothetical protein
MNDRMNEMNECSAEYDSSNHQPPRDELEGGRDGCRWGPGYRVRYRCGYLASSKPDGWMDEPWCGLPGGVMDLELELELGR